jgi:hypothetical protein
MPDQQLLKEHQDTWNGFVKLIVWSTAAAALTSTAAAALTLLLMRIFLV